MGLLESTSANETTTLVLALLHKLVARVEGVDLELARRGAGLCVVQQLGEVPVVVVGDADPGSYPKALRPCVTSRVRVLGVTGSFQT